MEARTSYLLAAALGGLAGIRSLLAPAFASSMLARHQGGRNGGAVLGALAAPRTAQVLSGLMAAELLVDKLPILPDRTRTGLLAVRAGAGATAGAAVCSYRGHPVIAGAVVGALAAVAVAYVSLSLRKAVAERAGVPQQLPGMVEDAAALALGMLAARAAFAPPVTRG